jgi:hypothetical protein
MLVFSVFLVICCAAIVYMVSFLFAVHSEIRTRQNHTAFRAHHLVRSEAATGPTKLTLVHSSPQLKSTTSVPSPRVFLHSEGQSRSREA